MKRPVRQVSFREYTEIVVKELVTKKALEDARRAHAAAVAARLAVTLSPEGEEEARLIRAATYREQD